MSSIEQTYESSPAHLARRQEAAMQTLRRRAAFLPDAQRVLIELIVQQKLSRRAAARLLGLPPGTVTRRLQRLAARLYDPLVIALIERPGELREEYRQLAIEYFLHKQTAARLADLHRLPVNQVRRILEFVKGWFRGISQRRNF